MLERLRQVVGREIRHRAGGVAASEVDKTDERYVRKLQQARGNTAAVRGCCATEEQARIVLLHRRTDQEYADLAAFCRVNEKLAPETYRCFRPVQDRLDGVSAPIRCEARQNALVEARVNRQHQPQVCVVREISSKRIKAQQLRFKGAEVLIKTAPALHSCQANVHELGANRMLARQVARLHAQVHRIHTS